MNYSDSQAKAILRDTRYWPACSCKWDAPKSTKWIRAQPVEKGKKVSSSPVLRAPGQTLFQTQPDGLWLLFHDLVFCDAMVIEHCGTIQNLNDKRSRFIGGASSLMVCIPANWFNGQVKYKKGLISTSVRLFIG
jgi:hypothetical protein